VGLNQLIFPPKWCHVGLASICHFLVLGPMGFSIYGYHLVGLLYFIGPWTPYKVALKLNSLTYKVCVSGSFWVLGGPRAQGDWRTKSLEIGGWVLGTSKLNYLCDLCHWPKCKLITQLIFSFQTIFYKFNVSCTIGLKNKEITSSKKSHS
jgi:hypothetical protein